jgi:glycosyltransferase involved in cell wall biosynthesis
MHLDEKTFFAGRIQHNELVTYYNMIDIFVNVSRNESFGVSVLEASACGKPVVVSNAGGLTEVVKDQVTGFTVTPENVKETSDAIEKLILDKNLRDVFGKNGRNFVIENYNWNSNVEEMIEVYKTL